MRLIIIFGPSAVGKMTVGRELARLTGMTLFHNHLTIEPLIQLFPYGSASFTKLNRLFREKVFEEVAANGGPGLIFTYLWALDDVRDKNEIDYFVERFGNAADAIWIELFAHQDVRLQRNGTELRLDQKASKRDVAWSNSNLLDGDRRYVLNSSDEHPFFYPERHLRIDNSALRPEDVARQVVAHFALEMESK